MLPVKLSLYSWIPPLTASIAPTATSVPVTTAVAVLKNAVIFAESTPATPPALVAVPLTTEVVTRLRPCTTAVSPPSVLANVNAVSLKIANNTPLLYKFATVCDPNELSCNVSITNPALPVASE